MKEDNNIIDLKEKLSEKEDQVLRDAIKEDLNDIHVPENLPKLWNTIEKKINKKNKFKKIFKTGKYIAACFVTFFILSFTIPCFNQETNASIISMLRQFVGTFNGQTNIDFTNVVMGIDSIKDENVKQQLMNLSKNYDAKIYVPTDIPKNYYLQKIKPTIIDNYLIKLQLVYFNNKNKLLVTQHIINDDENFSSNLGLSNNYATIETVCTSNYQSTLVNEKNTSNYLYILNTKASYFEIEGTLSKEDIINVGKSLIPKK